MRRTRRSPTARPPARGYVAHAAAIAIVGAIVYWNSLGNPFIFDDRGSIVDNASIEDLGDPAVFSAPHETPVAGRPVVNLTFALNYAIGERDVTGYHVSNLAIHLVCAWLVFGIVRRTLDSLTFTSSRDVAFAIALVWAVHPLNTEVINYTSQRTESLMALFYLLTLYASIRARGRRGRRRWEAIAVASCAMGMACKESMATAPIVVFIFDRVFLFDSVRHAVRSRWRLYAGLAATWIVLALLIRTAPRTLSAGFTAHDAAPWTYLLNQAVMVTRYLRLAFWPQGFTIYYGWPLPLTLGDVWPRALLIFVLLLLTVLALIRRPRLGFLGVWFFLTLAPTSSIVPIATEVGAERRMYLPLIAVVTFVVLAFVFLHDRVRRSLARRDSPRKAQIAPAVVLVIVCAVLGACTMIRNREYATSLRLAETTLQRWPTPAAHSMLGTELAAAGRLTEAEAHLRVAAPNYPPARYYLGTVLAQTGKPAEAIDAFEEFIREQPPRLDQVHLARALLADLLTKQGRSAEAIEQYRLMLQARPADAEARSLLAAALVRHQAYPEAIEQYRQVLSEHPTDVQALGGLGIALASNGKVDEAIVAFRRAVNLDPANTHAQQNLARALELAAEKKKQN